MRNEVKLDNLLPIILGPNGLAHSSSIVRKAACTALASIADECNLSDYHLLIMNGLFAFIQQCEQTHLSLLQNQACTESSLKMMKLVISTLDTVVEGLEENVVPYLPVVMELLARVLNMVQDYTMQAKVVGVFGSAARIIF